MTNFEKFKDEILELKDVYNFDLEKAIVAVFREEKGLHKSERANLTDAVKWFFEKYIEKIDLNDHDIWLLENLKETYSTILVDNDNRIWLGAISLPETCIYVSNDSRIFYHLKGKGRMDINDVLKGARK